MVDLQWVCSKPKLPSGYMYNMYMCDCRNMFFLLKLFLYHRYMSVNTDVKVLEFFLSLNSSINISITDQSLFNSVGKTFVNKLITFSSNANMSRTTISTPKNWEEKIISKRVLCCVEHHYSLSLGGTILFNCGVVGRWLKGDFSNTLTKWR